MTPEEFLLLAESIRESDNTGRAGDAKTFFAAVYLGEKYPGIDPPSGDGSAEEGYKLGRKLSKRLKNPDDVE